MSASLGGGSKANYRADSGPTVVRGDIQVDSKFHQSSGGSNASPTFNFNWSLNGVPQSQQGTVNTTMVPKDEQGSFYFAIDSTTLASGYYNVSGSMNVASSSGPAPGPSSTSLQSWVPIISQDDYGFGKGWNLAGIERLVVPPPELTISEENPVYWLRSDGYVLKFNEIGATAENDVNASVLSLDNGHFVVTNKHGNKSSFLPDGWIQLREDRYGNGTLFLYKDVNGDGVHREIDKVIDQTNGHETIFDWHEFSPGSNEAPRVEKIVDYAGRETLLDVSSGTSGHRLMGFTLPDGSMTYFGYESGRLAHMYDAEGRLTQYKYSPDGQTVTTEFWADGNGGSKLGETKLTHTQVSAYSRVYPGGAQPGSATALVSADIPTSPSNVPLLIGSSTDELGRVTTFETDPDTRYVKKITDPSGRITEYERNSVGQLTLETLYDSDGATVLDQTEYTYDAKFNLTDITHVDGTSEHWTYDSLSRVTSYTDELDRKTLYTYQDYTGPTIIGEQFVTVCQVVGLNDLTSSEFDDLVTTYEYDSRGLMIEMTEKRVDPDGTALADMVTQYTYTIDAAGCGCGGPAGVWLESVTYAVGTSLEATVTVLDHDDAGNPIQVQDELGRVTTYHYDELNRVEAIVAPDPDGGGLQWHPITIFTYTLTGRLDEQVQTSGEDPLDRLTWTGDQITTTFQYDRRGRLERSTTGDFSASAEIEYDYDAAGNLLSETVAPSGLNRKTEYKYDLLNRPIQVQGPDPDGPLGPKSAPQILMTYDGLDRLTAERDEHNNLTRYEYDARHRLTKVIAPLGVTTQYFYDAAGQLLRETDPMGRTTTYTYDSAGRLTSVLEPTAAAPTTYQYDTLGNLRFITDPLSHTIEYQYDARGRLAKEIDANDAETTYTYTDANELETLTDPAINTTTWTYDLAGRVVSEENELGEVRSYKYDAFGRVIQVTDRNARVTTYAYDGLNRLRSEKWYTNQIHFESQSNPLREFFFDYDTAANELSHVWGYDYVTSTNDPEYFFTYDALGNATQSVVGLTGFTGYITFDREYDSTRLRETSVRLGTYYDGSGGVADYVNEYRYDALERLTRVTQQAGDEIGANVVAEKRVDFTYKKDGQHDRITRYANLAGTALVASSSFSYDARGRLQGLTHARNATVFVGYGFSYDEANRLTGFTNSRRPSESATYAYDDRGQLTGADYQTGLDHAYGYDDNGNRDSDGYTSGDNNQLLFDGTYHYSYDAEGNRTLKFFDTNEDSSWSVDEWGEEYTWDHRNRLTRVTLRNGPGGTVLKTVDYVYDAFNQLVKRVVDSDGAGSSPTAIDQAFYLYDDGQIVMEFHKNGSGAIEAQDLTRRYLWGPAVDQLLADETIDDVAVAGETLWALGDHQNTVRDLIDSSGTLRKHTQYTDAFGLPTGGAEYYDAAGEAITGMEPWTNPEAVGVDQRFYHTGRLYDKETGLQNNLHRWYDAGIGRWINEDPIGFAAGDANLYRYVGNAPTMYIDPSGLYAPIETDDGVVIVHPTGVVTAYGNGPHTPNPVETDVYNYMQTGNEAYLNRRATKCAIERGWLPNILYGINDPVGASNRLMGASLTGVSVGVGAANRPLPVARPSIVAEPSFQNQPHQQQQGNGSYINKHQSGKIYVGKGNEDRARASANRIAKQHNDPLDSKVCKPAADAKQSFIDEQNSIEASGGPGGNTYNKINSPGKKLRDGF